MSIQDLLDISRRVLTEEQREELQRRSQETCDRLHKEFMERHRCSECGADTWNYSHLFSCSLRGSGF